MTNELKVTGVAIAALIAASAVDAGGNVTAEQREAASLLARMETPLARRDQMAYCEAFHGGPAYRDYVTRACEFAVSKGVRPAAQCQPQAIAAEVEADLGKCLAMDRAAFEAVAVRQAEGRANFVKAMHDLGIDGNGLIAEERAKIK